MKHSIVRITTLPIGVRGARVRFIFHHPERGSSWKIAQSYASVWRKMNLTPSSHPRAYRAGTLHKRRQGEAKLPKRYMTHVGGIYEGSKAK
jgi:hypothetical protein